MNSRDSSSIGVTRFMVPLILLVAVIMPEVALAGELPLLKKTHYPYPSGAIFVATDGNDTHFGTLQKPLKSLEKAVEIAKPGDTIVIRAGTYREVVGGISKPLVFQPFPGEVVWLKGSEIITDWTRKGANWITTTWRSEFCHTCFHADNIDPRNPAAGLPEQVFVDGRALKQVESRYAITENTFYVDRKHRWLMIGLNPDNHRIEISNHSTALTVWRGAEGTKIRGLGFAHYAPVAQPGLGSAVKIDAARVEFENNTVTRSAVKGLEVFAADVRVTGNTFIENGMMGLAAWKADRLIVTGNRFIRNNTEHFAVTGAVSEAAGAKITVSRGIFVTDNQFHDNFANGLWLDINVRDAAVLRNTMRGNARHGAFFELSSHGRIVSNLVLDNGLGGIAVADSNRVDIYNNTIVDNRIGLIVQDDWRQNDDPTEVAAGNTWTASSIAFTNNFVGSFTPHPTDALVWVRDFEDQRSAEDMFDAMDYNQFHRATPSPPAPMIEWWSAGERQLFDDLSGFRSFYGFNGNSINTFGNDADAYFADIKSGNYQLRSGSPGWKAGTELPRHLRQKIGSQIGGPINIGILENF